MMRSSVTVGVLLLSFGTADAGETAIETVLVSAAGNPDDTSGLGGVTRKFRIGQFEVTNQQYVAFLNAVAAADPNGLYSELMTDSDRGGILRFGTPGSYSYLPKPDFGNKPVGSTDWLDAARFCNWLTNGQPSGAQGPATTESGSYDMTLPHDQITRQPSALWFIPTHDEWYKAAYYDDFDPGADAGGTPNYWLYPTRSDTQPTQAEASETGDVVNPGPNIANHSGGADWNDENGNVTTAGGCEATSPWGVFDMAGNINEWTETLGNPIPANPPDQPDPLPTRTARGGDFANPAILMSSPPAFAPDANMVAEGANFGFRVARLDFRNGDANHDEVVDVLDLLIVILNWGDCPMPPASCLGDVNGDATVNVVDLLDVILNWD